MRVISGSRKGRILAGPKSDKIRPALDKIKQAIFNILGNMEGLTVLDLFAGTGSIGIEALSRGAVHAVFVDGGAEAIRLIRKNLQQTGFDDPARVLRLRIPSELKRIRHSTFDLIFIDPPYDRNLVNPTIRAVAREKILAPSGTVVIEHSPREPVADDAGLVLADQRKYGQTLISFLRSVF